MDDKRFDEIMNKYVASTARGKDADFAKLREKAAPTGKRQKLRLALSSVSMLLVVAISLIVALPYAFQPNNSAPDVDYSQSAGETPAEEPPAGDGKEETPPGYCDDDDYAFIMVESLDVVVNEYGINAMPPKIENMFTSTELVMKKNSDAVIGARTQVLVYNEYLNDILVYMFEGNKRINSLFYYDSFKDKCTWRELTVVYYTKSTIRISPYYEYHAYFVYNGCSYYLEANGATEMTITELLDMVY